MGLKEGRGMGCGVFFLLLNMKFKNLNLPISSHELISKNFSHLLSPLENPV